MTSASAAAPVRRRLVSILNFFLDKGGEKNCFLVGSKNLTMSSGDKYGSENCWEYIYNPKSRYSSVAELRDSRHLYIECVIKTRMLSPHTLYAAYLVFGLTENHAKLHSAVSIIRNFCGETGLTYPKEQVRIVQFERGGGRKEDWSMEIELGDFYVGPGENGEVQVQLLDTSGYWKRGLIVEGIEFRPLTPREIRRQIPMHYPDLTLDHTVWKTMLPPDKREVIWRSACLRFFLDKNGRNCFLFGAYSRPGISPQPGYKFIGYPNSRFPYVVELQNTWGVDISCRIRARLFSPGTIYVEYLLIGYSYKDERAPQKALSFVGIDEGVWDYGYSKELARIVEFGRSKERPDRWREIEIGKFYTGLEEDRYVGEVSDVLVQLLGSTGYVIEGIEFRPLDEDEERVENLPEEVFSD